MLEVCAEEHGSIAVIRVSGRFDATGAISFEQGSGAPVARSQGVVLDLGGVSFLSSAGVRSLVKAELALRARHSSLLLVGLQPLVAQVLDLSGLAGELRRAGTVEEALLMARNVSVPVQRAECTVHGRAYDVVALEGGNSRLEAWGPEAPATESAVRVTDLLCLSLADLGLAFGVGGLGGSRDEATTALGPFLATGSAAVLAAAGQGGEPDFVLSPRPAESVVYVAAATGVAGKSRWVLELPEVDVSIEEVLGDLPELIERRGGSRAGQLAIVIAGEIVELHGGTPEDSAARSAGADHRVRSAPGEWLVVVGAASPGFRGVGARVSSAPSQVSGRTPGELRLEDLVDTEQLRGVLHVAAQTRLRRGRAWVFLPDATVAGADKLLQIVMADDTRMLDEWQLIARRLYTDARRVVLKALTGGYNATTFRVTSFDADGRQMLPTILKISTLPFTDREERAHHEYVQKFILNNSTVIMGRATQGAWAGLRYNFLGITGPGSALSWLADHYVRRPSAELAPILDQLFGKILWPWYGQPRPAFVRPFEEHDPSELFPTILKDAERLLGCSPESPFIQAPELGCDLPNPFHFLAHELPARRSEEVLFNSTITHGDLNLNNVLLDERDNVFVIDFSETRPRGVTADFARLEPLLALQLTRLAGSEDLAALARFWAGLLEVRSLAAPPRLVYPGDDPMVAKAYDAICLLRRHAAAAAAPHATMVPYLLALFEWTVVISVFRQVDEPRRRLSMLCAGLICRRLGELESRPRET